MSLEPLESRLLLAASIPPLPTPIAHWTLDEGAGTTAIDLSGNGHTATLGAGASWVSGNVGTGAVQLNGSSTGALTVTGPVIDTSSSFTVSAWVNLSSLSGFQTFVSIAGNTVAGFFLQLRGDTGTFSFTRLPSDANGTATFVSATSAPSAGTWYHVVGVSDAEAGKLTLYVDGQSMGSVNFTSAWTATGNTYIGQGRYSSSQVDYVNGLIDHVQFFSTALTGEQVAALDHPAKYPFDEGAGTIAEDYSGHGHTLDLGQGASWVSGHIGTNAVRVDGTPAGVAVNPSPVLDTAMPFSVSAWVKLDAVSGTQTFVSIDGLNVSGFALQLRSDTGRFAFTRQASDSDAAQVHHADATSEPLAGVWYNLIGVNDVANSRLQLYVNGVLQSSVTYSGGWQATGATVVGAGRHGGVATGFASGLVDDVRFYNSPLSASAALRLGTGGNSIINVTPINIGVDVSPLLFGAFMEDINYGAEGGVYSNEVRNSGFNDSTNPLRAWSAVAGAGVVNTLTSDTTTGPTSALTMSGMLAITSGVSADARAGIANSGFFGVAVAPSTTYTAVFYAKATAGFTGPLTVSLESNAGTVYASAAVSSITTDWARYTVTLTTDASAPLSSANRFVIATDSATANGQTLWFGATYLYPPSYMDSPANLRVDLMEMLAALKPAFFRVPGGNYLEGNTYEDRFNWEATIGPVEERPGHYNSAWGYWSTDGLGLDEYLQMAELIGAEPVLGIYAGYTLNGTTDTGQRMLDNVTSAINELHYVLDPVTTYWGALRAANGHPEPYNINYVEVGNEDWFSSTYPARYPLFYDAIRAEFPQLKIIATSTATGGRPFDVLDDHYYNSAQWFLSNSGRYDNAARGSYKIFVGEYAAREGNPTSTMAAGLGDAAFLMGLMRNSDLVIMSAYAPLWVNVNGMQWSTDLIGFNNTTCFGSASYYAQKVLNLNHGEQVVGSSVVSSYGLQTLVTRTGNTYYLTVVNPSGTASDTIVNIAGMTTVSANGTAVTLSASAGNAVNSISNPTNIVPVESTVYGLAPNFLYTFAPYSLTVLQFTAEADPPSLAMPAAAAPSVVTGTTTTLQVLGADPTGEENLIYNWSTVGTPPAPVSFSVNGTNDAKNTMVTFTKPGTYEFAVTIVNGAGLTVTSDVSVSVVQTLAGMGISPAAFTVAPGGSVPFSAHSKDQFGVALEPISQVTWSVIAGEGSIDAAGVFAAPAGEGDVTIGAVSATGQMAYSTITVLEQIAWYPADADSGSALPDASGNGHDASLLGAAAFAPGLSGNALRLTGGHASLPTGIVSDLNDFTIAAWVKIDTLSNWSRIFDFGTGESVNMFLTPRNSVSNVVRFAITTSGSGGEQRINGTAALATGVWQHVAVTLAGNLGTLYVNGTPVGTNPAMTLRPSSLGSTSQNYLGDSQYSNDPAFLGSIDDFRIIGRALSAAEIAHLVDPSVLIAATVSDNPVNAATAALWVLGADATGGEASLTYTWSATGAPPAPVTFSVNGTNAARDTLVTFTRPGTYDLVVTIRNAAGREVTSGVNLTVINAVVGRWLFYRNSILDAVSPDNAIATDKSALLPDQQATFENYSTYSRGINGIMIDLSGPALAPGSLSTADFLFKAGNDNMPGAWATAPMPQSITVRPGDGVGGSTRVEIAWTDYAIEKQWLQVTVLANPNTGLADDDVFYYGHLPGDASGNGIVDITDLAMVANRWQETSSGGGIGDFNLDGIVDIVDLALVANNWQTSVYLPFMTKSLIVAAAVASEPLSVLPTDTGETSVPLASTRPALSVIPIAQSAGTAPIGGSPLLAPVNPLVNGSFAGIPWAVPGNWTAIDLRSVGIDILRPRFGKPPRSAGGATLLARLTRPR